MPSTRFPRSKSSAQSGRGNRAGVMPVWRLNRLAEEGDVLVADLEQTAWIEVAPCSSISFAAEIRSIWM